MLKRVKIDRSIYIVTRKRGNRPFLQLAVKVGYCGAEGMVLALLTVNYLSKDLL